MIYTLTVNPAIDYHMDLTRSGFTAGQINRSQKEEMFPGGKGLNVSVVLSRLGVPSIAWGFTAGRTGTLLESLAGGCGCRCDFIRLPQGETRINVKLDCDEETAVNGCGPEIGAAQTEELLRKVRQLTPEDTLILSGNLQAGPVNLYEAASRICHENGVRFVADTEGDNLKATLPYHPFLIKPNEEELLALYNETGKNDLAEATEALLISLMEKCRADGARNVLVTLGSRGALFLSEEGDVFRVTVTGDHKIVSTVGAGDSAIAGFLAGLQRCGMQSASPCRNAASGPAGGSPHREHYRHALRLSCAAGTATACAKWLCSGEAAEDMIRCVDVSEVRQFRTD